MCSASPAGSSGRGQISQNRVRVTVGTGSYLQVAGGRRHGGDDGGLGASAQRVLQDPGEFGLSMEEPDPQLNPDQLLVLTGPVLCAAHLYGMWGLFSTRAVMTRPSVSSDWLMFPASRARLSTAPERPMFSLPARSTWTEAGRVSPRARPGRPDRVRAVPHQVELADLHQLLAVQRDLLHVDGDGEHGVGAAAERRAVRTWF